MRSLGFAEQTVLVVALLLSGSAFADDAPRVDADVSDVLLGGTIKQDYRVVVECGGFEHVQCRVWAQWLKHDTGGTEITHSTPIQEINDHGYSIGRLERLPVASSFKAAADVTHTHIHSATGRFEIELRESGQYNFRWLQEPSFAEVE